MSESYHFSDSTRAEGVDTLGRTRGKRIAGLEFGRGLNGGSGRLPAESDLRNLVGFSDLPHTRFTYHRTWETGLETEIRVAAFNPAFFCLESGIALRFTSFPPFCLPISCALLARRFWPSILWRSVFGRFVSPAWFQADSARAISPPSAAHLIDLESGSTINPRSASEALCASSLWFSYWRVF